MFTGYSGPSIHPTKFMELPLRLISSFLALALSASTAWAADVAPLRPGYPAGVKPAQDYNMGDHTLLYVGLGAAVIAGIALAASSGNDAPVGTVVNPVTTTTTTTATTT